MPLYVGLLCVVVGLLAASSHSDPTPGWAPPLSTGGAVATFLAPLTAGATVIHLQRRRAAGWLAVADATPSGQWGAIWLAATANAFVGLVALAAALVVTSLRAQLPGPFSWAMLLLPAMAATMILSSAFFGALVATRTRNRLAGPALAILVYAFGYALTFVRVDGPAWLVWLQPYPLDFFYGIATQPNVMFWAPKVMCLLGLTLAVAFLLRRHRLRALAAAALSLAIVASVAVGTASSEVVAFRPTPDTLKCRAEPPLRVCAWPEAADEIPQGILEKAVLMRGANETIVSDMPSVLVQPGLEGAFEKAAVVDVFDLGDSVYLNIVILDALVPTGPCLDDAATQTARREVAELMALRAGVSLPEGGPDLSSISQSSEREQRDWVASRLAQASDCVGDHASSD